jgi:prephenate dehydratase
MPQTIAYLGPAGTYAEAAAFACADWLKQISNEEVILHPYASIAKALKAASNGQATLAVVPAENSIEGGVTTTLDMLWQLENLQIQLAIVLPILHAMISRSPTLEAIRRIYSHPQALAQCQGWIESFLPEAEVIPINSTTEALRYVEADEIAGAIASQRAAQMYNLPVLAHPINDHPDNFTRFWMLSLRPATGGTHTSLAFSFPNDAPGTLAGALQIFAHRHINLSRIESRPTKRSLGEYLFFIDIEADIQAPLVQSALQELAALTETLKLFGSYSIISASVETA